MVSLTVMERLMGKVTVDPESRCWEWQGSRHPKGYGCMRVPATRRNARTHRLAYEIFVGPIPEGLQLDHLCRNRACCNPAHLEPVTNRENARRGLRATMTHCKRGHAFDEANTARYPSGAGGRWCRACEQQRWPNRRQAYNARRRERYAARKAVA